MLFITDAMRKQQAARSTSSSTLKPNPSVPATQPKSILTTNEVMTDTDENNNSNNKLRTPPPKPPTLGGSPQPNPPKKRTTQII